MYIPLYFVLYDNGCWCLRRKRNEIDILLRIIDTVLWLSLTVKLSAVLFAVRLTAANMAAGSADYPQLITPSWPRGLVYYCIECTQSTNSLVMRPVLCCAVDSGQHGGRISWLPQLTARSRSVLHRVHTEYKLAGTVMRPVLPAWNIHQVQILCTRACCFY